MADPFANHHDADTVVPAQRIDAVVAGTFKAKGNNFATESVDALDVDFTGIPGDYHAGHIRKSGGREPWYPRGTEMANERQLSILSPAELRVVARALNLPEVKAEWIGGNLTIDGIDDLTLLPPRTCLFFEGGVTLRIDGDNAPCRVSGRAIASHFEGRDDVELEFAKAARNRRGLVAWVEKPGTIKPGEKLQARIPPQRLYRA